LFYYAYGLQIGSQIQIPEFTETNITEFPDVKIIINRVNHPQDYISQEILQQAWAVHLNREKALVYLKDIGVFLIEAGKKITLIPYSKASKSAIRFYLVGTVMAILLYQRNFLVLHGSVINFENRAIVFLGKSGDGKSSTAAAFISQGYLMTNDDVAPVNLTAELATIYPGFSQVKLAKETAHALGYDFESLIVLHQSETKRGYRPQQEFSHQPLPIGRIYILGYDEDFMIQPLSPSEAVMELSRHSRPTTLFHSPDVQHFRLCTTLVEKHPLYRLNRPKDLSLLPKLVEFVKQDLANECSLTNQTLLAN
jgi:hypothetical protein